MKLSEESLEIEIRHNPAQSRFEAPLNETVSLLVYSETRRHLTAIHTEVPPALQGRGIASALSKAALDYARARDLSVIPQCPFVANFIHAHPEYADLVASE